MSNTNPMFYDENINSVTLYNKTTAIIKEQNNELCSIQKQLTEKTTFVEDLLLR